MTVLQSRHFRSEAGFAEARGIDPGRRGAGLSRARHSCCLPELQLIDTFPVTRRFMQRAMLLFVCAGGEDGGVATAALRFDTVEQAGK